MLPDPETGQRKHSYAVRAPWVGWVKAAFEEYFMVKMRLGVGMPWYERLGLRTLFGLRLLGNETTSEQPALTKAKGKKQLVLSAVGASPNERGKGKGGKG